MKRLCLILLVIIFGALGLSAQTLADAAKQAQTDKKSTAPTHVYTNDDIAPPTEPAPAPEKPSATSDATATTGDDTAKAGTDAAAGASDKAAGDKPADKKDSKETTAAKSDALKDKIAALKKSIADQQHDVDIMEREHQIKVAEYYADAGTQLRTSGKWFDDEKQYQADLDAKKKAISDSKTQLDDLNEQARKAGVPTS